MTKQIKVICKRCDGSGVYQDFGQCFKCGGVGILTMSERSAKEWGYTTVEQFRAIKQAQAEQTKTEQAAEFETLADAAIVSIERVAGIVGFVVGEIDRGLMLDLIKAETAKPHGDRSRSGYVSRAAAEYVKAKGLMPTDGRD